MKLFVDDIREPYNKTWTIAKTHSKAIAYLDDKKVNKLSLDHDLGVFMTGYDICKWMIVALAPAYWPVDIVIHSANPIGAEKMHTLLAIYKPASTGLLRLTVEEYLEYKKAMKEEV